MCYACDDNVNELPMKSLIGSICDEWLKMLRETDQADTVSYEMVDQAWKDLDIDTLVNCGVISSKLGEMAKLEMEQ